MSCYLLAAFSAFYRFPLPSIHFTSSQSNVLVAKRAKWGLVASESIPALHTVAPISPFCSSVFRC